MKMLQPSLALVALGLSLGPSAHSRGRVVAVLDAPSNLGLRPPRPGAEPGAAKLAAALRSRRLLERLQAEDAGHIVAPAYSPEPEPETWFRNGKGVAAFSEQLADRVGRLVQEGKFPLVLGGDCSILIGNTLGLHALGRYGLIFIDGHDDFSVVRDLDEYKGRLAAAGLDLAVATGRAPGGLCDLRGRRPYVREEDVVLFGLSRDPEDSKLFATEALDTTDIRQLPVQRVRELGPEAAAREALRLLVERPLDGIWIHLDADVLDQKLMPAVDSPNPDGLDFEQLGAALGVLLADPRVAGLDVAIYDPELDPQGVHGDRLVDMLLRAFGR
jgi:arginase